MCNQKQIHLPGLMKEVMLADGGQGQGRRFMQLQPPGASAVITFDTSRQTQVHHSSWIELSLVLKLSDLVWA